VQKVFKRVNIRLCLRFFCLAVERAVITEEVESVLRIETEEERR
jgi:hypothetical protein